MTLDLLTTMLIINIIMFFVLIGVALGYRQKVEEAKLSREENAQKEQALFLQSRYASMGEMVSNIIHQWREPLGAVGAIQSSITARIMFGQTIDKDSLLESAQASSNLLQHLSETIETFYGFLKNKNDLEATFSLKSTLETIKKIMSYSLERDNITLTYAIAHDCIMQGRENEFSQALVNIISNARDILIARGIKNRAIHIEVHLRENTCLITVRDNAGGIELSPPERVFEPFLSAKGGSGIGLYMTKTIVTQRFGGTISVKNEGNGALFCLEVPYTSSAIDSEKDFDKEITSVAKMMGKIVELENAEKDMRKWADIFQQTHWGIAIHKAMSSKFESVNPAFLKMYGYSAEEIEHIEIQDCLDVKSLETAASAQQEALSSGFVSFTTIAKKKDGSTFDVRMNITVVKDRDDTALYHIANIYDITEEKQQKRLLDTVVFAIDHVADAAFLVDKNGKLRWVNDSACRSLGYAREELLGMCMCNIDLDCTADKWSEFWTELENRQKITLEVRHQKKNGSIFPAETTANFIVHDGIEYNLSIARDISERRLSEETLQNTITKLTNFASTFQGVMYTYRLDKDGNATMLYTSDRLYELFGVENHVLEENGNFIMENLVHPDERERVTSKVIDSRESMTLCQDEFRIIHPTKGVRWIETQSTPQAQDDGSMVWYGLLIDITERKNAEKNLLLVNKALNNTAEAVYIMIDDCFAQVNDGACNMLGYSREEFAAIRLCDIDPSFSQKNLADNINAMMANDGSLRFERQHHTKDGRILDVEIVINIFEYDGIHYSFSAVRDITEQKKAREELLLKEFALNSINDAVFLIDENSSYCYVNESACKSLGYSKEELLTLGVVDIDPDVSLERWREIWSNLKEQKKFYTETKHQRKDGTTFPIEVSGNYLEYNGVKYSLAVTRNITERLQLEEQKDNERMKLFFERQLVGMAITSPEKGWLHTNEKLRQMLGYTHEELTQLTWAELTHPDDLATDVEQFERLLKGEIEDYMLEKRFICKDGSIVYTNIAVSFVRNDDRTINYVLALLEDITEQKRTHEALVAKEQELRALAESSPGMMGAFYMRPDGSACMPYASPNIYELFGVRPEDVRDDATTLLSLSHPDDSQRVEESIAESGRTMSVWHEEYRIIHPTKGERWMEGNTMPQPHPEGGIIWYGYVHDITERKAAEQELQRALEFNEGIIGAIPDLLFEIAPDGTYLGVWAQNEELLIVQREALLGKNFKNVLPPKAAEIARKTMREVNERGFSLGNTYSLDLPDGKMWFELSMSKRRSSGTYIVLSRDVTKRKATENSLQESEHKFRTLIESSLDNIISYDKDMCTKYLNPRLLALLDIPLEMKIGKTPTESTPDGTYDEYENELRRVIATGDNGHVYIALLDKDGEMRHHHIHIVAERDTSGDIIGALAFGRDVTELKNIEQQLLVSYDFLYQLINSIHDPLFVKDRDHRWIILNDANIKLTGFPRESLIGKSDYDIFPAEQAKVFWDKDEEVFNSRGVSINEEFFTSADGVTHCIETIKSMFVAKDGKEYLVGTIRDITKRKCAEDAVKELNTSLEERVKERTHQLMEALKFNESVINAIPDLLFEVDKDGKYLNVWAQNEELLAAQKEILLGHRFADVLSAEATTIALEGIHEADEKGLSFGKTIKIDLAGGGHWFELSISKKGETFLMLSRDITERKAAEELQIERLALEERLSKIASAAPGVNYIFEKSVSGEYRFTYLTPSFEELFGISTDIALNDFATAIGQVHPEDFERIQHSIEAASIEPSVWHEEFRIVHSQKITAWIEGQSVPEAQPDGSIVWYGFFYDITEHKDTGAALAKSEEAFRALIQNTHDYIARYDTECRRIYLNPAMQSLFNQPLKDVLGKTPYEFSPLLANKEYEKLILQAVESRKPSTIESSFKSAEGKERWAHMHISPEFDTNGKVISVLAVGRDITDLKTTGKQLDESLKRYDTLVNNQPDLIARFDTECRNVFVNKAVCDAYRQPMEFFIGKTLCDVDDSQTNRQLLAAIKEAIRTGKTNTLEAMFPSGDEMHYFEVQHIPEFDENGTVISVIGIAKDIHKYKR